MVLRYANAHCTIMRQLAAKIQCDGFKYTVMHHAALNSSVEERGSLPVLARARYSARPLSYPSTGSSVGRPIECR